MENAWHRKLWPPHTTRLITQGASVDPPDKARCTPLFKAAANGGIETVQLLLERGADVTFKSVEQKSILHAAVQHADVMELLLKVGLHAMFTIFGKHLVVVKNKSRNFKIANCICASL